MPLTTFLNGGTATQLRGIAWLALSDSGQVGAGTVTGDSGGGGTTNWNYGGTVPCRLDPLAGTESVVAARLDDRSTHLITVPADTSVTHNDRFLISGRGTFEVTALRERTAGWTLPLEAVEVS